MIIDCFTYFNERDLLKLRWITLGPYVDAFVLCEANRTFQGQPRKYHFAEDKHTLFFRDGPRILRTTLHVVHCDLSKYGSEPEYAWFREAAQRQKILDELWNLDLKPNDEIILSDIDEIPVPDTIAMYPGAVVSWRQDLYYYWVNLRCDLKTHPGRSWWMGSMKCTWGRLNGLFLGDMQALRDARGQRDKALVINGGWHFSFLGGPEAIKTKIEAFSHTEYRSCADPEIIKFALESGWKQNLDLFGRDFMQFTLLPDDSHLPSYLREHKDKLRNWWYQESPDVVVA